MDKIFGSEILSGEKIVNTSEVKSKYFGIYFGAHWAPPCRLFTSTLKTYYEEQKVEGGEQFEVIFVSLDGNEEAFFRNYSEMPWLAVPYKDETRISALKQRYGINGIPTLVILNHRGDHISYDGRKDI